MKTIAKYKTLEVVKMDTPINGGFYAVRENKQRVAKTGLSLDAALDVFYGCLVNVPHNKIKYYSNLK